MRSYPEPLSFSARVSVLLSDALLTLSLDWLALRLASAPAADGSFLFFLAKNLLNVWNLDFFFPEKTESWIIAWWCTVTCWWEHYTHGIFTHCPSVNSSYRAISPVVDVKTQVGSPEGTTQSKRCVCVCLQRPTWKLKIHICINRQTQACKPTPTVGPCLLAPQWKNSTALL